MIISNFFENLDKSDKFSNFPPEKKAIAKAKNKNSEKEKYCDKKIEKKSKEEKNVTSKNNFEPIEEKEEKYFKTLEEMNSTDCKELYKNITFEEYNLFRICLQNNYQEKEILF